MWRQISILDLILVIHLLWNFHNWNLGASNCALHLHDYAFLILVASQFPYIYICYLLDYDMS